MKRGTPGHWKIQNLAMELKIEPYAAVGLCCCMWEWVGNSLMTGNIGKADDAVIARQIGWTKKPSVLIDALVKVGLLDRHPEHRLVVHDWSTHADDGVHTWLVRRGLRFADGKAPRWRHLNSGEREQADAFYSDATPSPQPECGTNVATPPEGHNAKADGTERYGTDRNGSGKNNVCSSQATNGVKEKTPPRLIPDYTEAFNAFWNRYPRTRRVNKKGAFAIWLKDQIERPPAPGKRSVVEVVMASLEAHKKCDSWMKGFDPMPATFLGQRRWTNDPPQSETPQ